MPRSTKAQIQIGETVAVLIVFLILIVFGLYWFSTASGANIVQERSELERLELAEVSKIVMNLPELQCSSAARSDATCIDQTRVKAFRELLVSNDTFNAHYQDAFFANTRGSYELTIHNLFTDDVTTVFNYTGGDAQASTQRIAIPIILQDPVEQQNHFSMLVLKQEVAP